MNNENSILFLGDVAAYHPYSFKSRCATIINLECPITKKGTPSPGKIILGAKENYLRQIFGQNLLAVSLGNNHILDYGPEGLDSTVAALEDSEIKYFGLNLPGNNPLIIKFNGLKIALISAVCESTSPIIEFNNATYLTSLHVDSLSEKIRKARKEADRIVIYIHWGEEESSLPLKRDIAIAHRLIDEGADIIIGAHAHAPQPFERYRHGIIAYNLGNFIMPELKNSPSYFDQTGTARSVFTRRLMLWNRISWGIEIDLKTLEFRIRRYIFNRSKVTELPFTHLDRYQYMETEVPARDYELKIRNHLKRRKIKRRIADFIHNPHVPQFIKPKP